MVKVVSRWVAFAKVTPEVSVYHWVNIILSAVRSFAFTVTVAPAIAVEGVAVPKPFIILMLCGTSSLGKFTKTRSMSVLPKVSAFQKSPPETDT